MRSKNIVTVPITKTGLTDTGVMYELPGSIQNAKGIYQGTYQIGTRPSESGSVEMITHYFFKPTSGGFTPISW